MNSQRRHDTALVLSAVASNRDVTVDQAARWLLSTKHCAEAARLAVQAIRDAIEQGLLACQTKAEAEARVRKGWLP